jgi:hypothetical protein
MSITKIYGESIVNDKETYAANVQRHVTLLLLYALFLLIGGLIACAVFLPSPINDKFLAIANPLITGIFGLTSGAVGFWIARTRQNSSDNTSPLDNPPAIPAQPQEKKP